MSSGENSTLKPWIWIVYVILFTVGIPWYWPTDDKTLYWGLPGWVWLALSFSILISTFTAWLLRKPWEGEDA